MALRPVTNAEVIVLVRARLGKLLGRTYILWLLGIAVGALKLQPTSFSVVGANFVLGSPDLIEGILYTGCICMYTAIWWEAVTTPYTPTSRSQMRKAILRAVRKKRKTLRGKTRLERRLIMFEARAGYRMFYWITVFGLTLPLLHILVYRREPLLKALAVITSKSA